MILTPQMWARMVALVLVTALLQVTFFARVEVFGTSPDGAVLVVMALGLLGGSVSGAVTGFSVGLLVDCLLMQTLGAFAAALMDRFGIRSVVIGALTLVALGAVLTTVTTQAWQLTLYWGLLVGLGTGAMAMTFAATVAGRWVGGLKKTSSRTNAPKARPEGRRNNL